MYARVENNVVVEYPVYQGEIQKRFPNTSFTIPFVPPEGYVTVVSSEYPQVDHTKDVVEDTPQNIDGTWTQVWSVVDATPEEIAQRTDAQANAVRGQRNSLLAACDWTQLADSPLDPEAKSAWAFYRENLRMVPQQPGFPWNVVWPPEPGTV